MEKAGATQKKQPVLARQRQNWLRLPHVRQGRLAVLASLYVAQGLPFGFFGQAIPVLMRQAGWSLLAISLSNLLALPWVLKLLWAPAFNRPSLASPRARRLSVLGLQLGAAGLLLLGTPLDPRVAVLPVFILVILSNFISATQDIPTDAMAVESLDPAARGLGNAAQVAGYRLGMVIGGGWLLTVLDQNGWSSALSLLAGALLLTALPLLVSGPLHPPRPQPSVPPQMGLTPQLDVASPPTPYFLAEGMSSWFGVLVIYKLGTSFGTGSLRPMMVDFGYTLSEIGWMLGTLGSGAAMVGSLVGGWLTTRIPRALPTFAFLQATALLVWVLASVLPAGPFAHDLVLAAILAEHFTSGIATTALFTAMMGRCRPGLAASDYTTQASTVLIADGLAAIISGASAQWLGYPLHLALAAIVAFSAVTATLRIGRT